MKKVIALLLTLIVGATWFAGCTPDPEAHAHEWSEWTVAAEASCEKDGKRVRECEGCGRKQYQVIEGGHQWGDWATVTPADLPGTRAEAAHLHGLRRERGSGSSGARHAPV